MEYPKQGNVKMDSYAIFFALKDVRLKSPITKKSTIRLKPEDTVPLTSGTAVH